MGGAFRRTSVARGKFVSGIDVFLSYSREDRAAIRYIAESFTADGMNVWWDAALQSGETFDEVIEQRLREAKAVVVLWSPRSVASRWVRAEATLADRKNKLVPAIIEPCDRPIAFELTHTADLSDWTGDTSDPRWRAFVKDVQRLVERNSGATEAPTPAAKPARTHPLREFRPGPAAEAASAREQLRPGNDDVIFASRANGQNGHTPKQPSAAPPQPEPVELGDSDEFHCLRLIDSGAGEELFVVGPSGLKIGRKPPADAVIGHPSVSRQHCVVGLANDELLVSDLNSTNGTFIDDERIDHPEVLPLGSVLRVGQVSLRHEIHSRAEASKLMKDGDPKPRPGQRPARFATAP